MTYKVFTEDFDRTVSAREAPVIELDANKQDFAPLSERVWQDSTAYIAKNYKINPDWVGELHRNILTGLGGAAVDAADVAVCLLLEQSARLRGGLGLQIMQVADLLAQALDLAGISLEIVGYTTSRRSPGLSLAKWMEEGQPEEPGRVADILYIDYKTPDRPWRQAGEGRLMMARDDVKVGNIDGEAIRAAAKRLRERPERRRVMILVNHGSPKGDDTRPYASRLLFEDYRRAVNEVKAAAIAIGQVKLGTGGMDAAFPLRCPLPKASPRQTVLEDKDRAFCTRDLAKLVVPR